MSRGAIIVYDWQAGREVERLPIPEDIAYSMAVYPSGEIFGGKRSQTPAMRSH